VTHPALIDAIRKTSADAADAVWTAARAEAARLRDDADRVVAEQRDAYAARLRKTSERARRAAALDADRRARGIRSAAKVALAGRLRSLAVAALPQLRDDAYPARFQALARELPDREWTRLTVNPADAALARRLFPRCEIAADGAITGGLVAEADGLRVSNTFDTRLAAAWPQLIPAVMSDVLEHDRCAQPAA
jgi:vacuolar-type H+-ATPase subunit E/Vma4